MKLPEPKYFTIEELATRWEVDRKRIEHYLIEGILKASIKLKATDLCRVFVDKDGAETFEFSYDEKGFFEIHPYEKIIWRESNNNIFGVCCDFVSNKVRLVRDNIMYSFTGGDYADVGPSCADRVIRYSDIIITAGEVKRFELENSLIAINCHNAMAAPVSSLELGSSTNQIDDATFISTNEILHNTDGLSDYVAQCRQHGEKEDQIVYKLMREYGQSKKHSKPNTIRLSALVIGMAVFPNRNFKTKKEKDALEAYVWKICNKVTRQPPTVTS